MTTEFIDTIVLECGCQLTRQIKDGRRELLVSPCKLTCRNYNDAIKLGREQGKPVEHP